MKIQRMLSNGNWSMTLDASDTAEFCDRAIEMNPSLNTRSAILAVLATGKSVRYGQGWHAKIRDADSQAKPRTVRPKLIACDCGHLVSKMSVMSTSTGTACPDCYDGMS